MNHPALMAAAAASRHRPAAFPHAPLPPWDHDNPDGSGIVHTTPPPELVIPSGPDNLFLRADFNGVNLDVHRWGTPPFVIGANTTPATMLMTPMAPLYPRQWQDAMLTEHAERGYSHFVVAESGWNFSENDFWWTPAQFAQWCQYVQSWGFFVVHWTPFPQRNDAYFLAALDAHAIDWYIAGEEVDKRMTAEEYDAALDNILAIAGRSFPVGAHFTANYPHGYPRDTFLTNWAPYDGTVHLMWQADQNNTAGTQGGSLYYARQRVNQGLQGDGVFLPDHAAPHSNVYAFETMASAQLVGACTEEYGCLRSLELLYTTRLSDQIRPMAGFGNGCRLPDGAPL